MVDRLRGRSAREQARRDEARRDGRSPSRPTRATRSGPASSSPATSSVRTRSSSSPAMADEFVELHGDRDVRRRRRDRRRVRPDRRPPGRRHRPAEGRRDRREHPAQLRDAPSRGLPQGDAAHGAGRALRPAGRHVHRRPGRPPRPGVGGARDRRRDRPLDRAHVPPADADRGGHHRRGRLGRRARDRRRRRRARPRERGLQRHQPGGLRLDPVADAGPGRRPRRWR